ncbi:unnamed protein product, partial [Didymodactylos carnosus]
RFELFENESTYPLMAYQTFQTSTRSLLDTVFSKINEQKQLQSKLLIYHSNQMPSGQHDILLNHIKQYDKSSTLPSPENKQEKKDVDEDTFYIGYRTINENNGNECAIHAIECTTV